MALDLNLRGFVADAVQSRWSERRPIAGDRPPSGCGDIGELGVTNGAGWEPGQFTAAPARQRDTALPAGDIGGLADAEISGSRAFNREPGAYAQSSEQIRGRDISGELGITASAGSQGLANRGDDVYGSRRPPVERAGSELARSMETGAAAGPTNGFWRDADWLFCRDGRWRPVESGTFPLAHGVAGRVGQLRAYGNAINVAQAQGFIEAYLDHKRDAALAGSGSMTFEDLFA